MAFGLCPEKNSTLFVPSYLNDLFPHVLVMTTFIERDDLVRAGRGREDLVLALLSQL